MTKKILIIEDNKIIHQLLKDFLKDEHYDVKSAFSAQEAKRLLNTESFDLIILDLVLPDENGQSIIEFVKNGVNTPIFVASSKSDKSDIAIHLGLGAVEYMVKPIAKIEFLARVNVILRSSSKDTLKNEYTLKIGRYEMNYEIFKCFKDDQDIKLTMKEYQILKLLLSDPKHVFSKKEIFSNIWLNQSYFDENLINVHMRRLRNKLNQKNDEEKLILTLWGFGYKINNSLIK